MTICVYLVLVFKRVFPVSIGVVARIFALLHHVREFLYDLFLAIACGSMVLLS